MNIITWIRDKLTTPKPQQHQDIPPEDDEYDDEEA